MAKRRNITLEAHDTPAILAALKSKYQSVLTAARNQTTQWLKACHANPGPYQSALSRLAVRKALSER